MNSKFAKPLFSLLLCIFAGASLYAQGNSRVTVNIENGKLKGLFEIIEKQTDYVFSYRDDALDNKKRITIDLKDVPVSKVLDRALNGTNLSYQIVSDKSIIITEKVKGAGKKVNIAGTVVDPAGEPIIGGTVFVKGSQQRISTDVGGNYSLDNVPVDATIVFSYIGYQPREIKASDKAALATVEMNEDLEILDEVVVVGYGTQKRANLTGAVATIGADDVNNRPVSSAAGALQGADPSVNLTFSTGSLDSDYSIDIPAGCLLLET